MNHNHMFIRSAQIAGDSQPVWIGLLGGKRGVLIIAVFYGRLRRIGLIQIPIEVTIYCICLDGGSEERFDP